MSIPRAVTRRLLQPGDVDEKLALVRQAGLERYVLELLDDTQRETARLKDALRAAQESIEKAAEALDRGPLLLATFVQAGSTGAVVVHGGVRRFVQAEGIEISDLQPGDDVLVNPDRAVIVDRSPAEPSPHGPTVSFERTIDDDRMLVRDRDDLRVVGVVPTLRDESWESGDLVRWQPEAFLARERLPRDDAREFAPTELPDVATTSIGGQAKNLDALLTGMRLSLLQPELAERYGLDSQMRALLIGPPGTGKTLLAKICASHLQEVSGEPCSFFHVKPGQFENMYVGETQRRIRQLFDEIRRKDGAVLLFIDEIESIGRARGVTLNHHGDKFLAALLAELDGFEQLAQTRLALIAATNRLDLLDPALTERLPLHLRVGRPDRAGARQILSIHLPETLPYVAGDRDGLIDRVLSSFYSPNGAGDICRLRFRDSNERVIKARELASGRSLKDLCLMARRLAAARELDGDARGLSMTDIDDSVCEVFESLRSRLDRSNIHSYISDLPQDIDVVAVEPIVPRVARPHRFVGAAS